MWHIDGLFVWRENIRRKEMKEKKKIKRKIYFILYIWIKNNKKVVQKYKK